MKKSIRLYISLIVIAVITYTQIKRLMIVPITWDEGLTYVFYVNRFFHSGDFFGAAWACLNGEIYCAANNHILNTLLIGISEINTGTRFNIAVIRFPIFVFWIMYTFACTRQFLKGNISSLAYVMLMCCSYINEFFALARGYGYSVALIAISLFFYKEWLSDDENRSIVWCFYALLLAELANTATLLVTATVAIVFLIKIISEKKFIVYWKRLWLPVSIWIASQLLVVKYHFLITEYDKSIANDRAGGVKSLVVNLISMPLTQRMVPRPLQLFLLALVLINIYILIKRKKVLNDYPYFMMLMAFIGICFASVVILKNFSDQAGYPSGRVLILTYPVCVMALEEMIMNCGCLLTDDTFKKIGSYVVLAASVFMFAFFMTTTNYKQSTDWPEAAACKKAAYEVYESKGEKTIGYLRDISYNTDAFIYWQQKILYEDGYDIFDGDPIACEHLTN